MLGTTLVPTPALRRKQYKSILMMEVLYLLALLSDKLSTSFQ
jgi:hypothetical protein